MKQNEVYTFSGILSAIKNKVLIHASVDEPRKYYAKRNKLDAERQILYYSIYVKYLEKANLYREKVDYKLPDARGVGNGMLLFNKFRVSIWGNEKFWK